MKRRIIRWTVAGIVVVAQMAVLFLCFLVWSFDKSVEKVYDIQVVDIAASADPSIVARGKHLSSVGSCTVCHGSDLGGKRGEPRGPIGTPHGPNLTKGRGGVAGYYSDAQLARVIRHGIKADGTTVLFMPSHDIAWWPDDDLVALVSFIRSLPAIDRKIPSSTVGVLGKVLDQLDRHEIDIARRVDHHAARPKSLLATPSIDYGEKLARQCKGCHGTTLAGGPLPGASPNLPVPSNITPHEAGIGSYTEADFMRLLETGVRKNGKKLDPFMPLAPLAAMNDVERKALWTYLRSLPPLPTGAR